MSWLSHGHPFISLRCCIPCFLTPYKQRNGKQKDCKANSSQDDVDILQAHCLNPWSEREEHNNSKQVSHENDANQDVAEDL
jgi:hypothetical protein